MRQFIVRTVTGPLDPHMLLERLWPGPQFRRMVMYSVVVHLCLITAVMIGRAVSLSINKMPAVIYKVDMLEMQRPAPVKKVAKVVAPKPKVEKPAPPKPEKVEIPKIVKAPVPKEKPPVVKVKPEPPKKAPPPPPPTPEPVKIAKVVEPEPEPEPTVEPTVELDTDQITPELKWYIRIVRTKVWSNWIEPRHALSSGANIRVVVRFEIGRSGGFTMQPTILEPSNNSFFDQSGLAAVMRSAPFPPLPESYAGETLGVQFGFEFGVRT